MAATDTLESRPEEIIDKERYIVKLRNDVTDLRRKLEAANKTIEGLRANLQLIAKKGGERF